MRQVTAKTLVHLIEAMDAGRAVTIRYAKPVKGGVEISRRRIDIHAIEVDGKGDILIQCFDHRSNSRHTFRLNRLTHVTLHRAPKLAAYRKPVVAEVQNFGSIDPLTGDEDAFTGTRAWDFLFQLTA